MSKVYVVNEIDFLYNDEVNYSEGDGGNPIEAYHSKVSADNAASFKNITTVVKEFRSGEFNYSLYKMDDLTDWALEAGLTEDDFSEEYGYTGQKSVKLTVEQAAKFLELTGIRFFTVSEIEFKD